MGIPACKITDLITQVAPEKTAAAWDKVGFQCGEPAKPVDSILLTLDVRLETIQTAINRNAGLIISHHPLIFRPLERIDSQTSPGRELTLLIENNIVLYVAHTNVDVSSTLSMNRMIGDLLPFTSFAPAAAPLQLPSVKLVTFIPEKAVDQIRNRLAEEGAGVIGEYTCCSFETKGEGTFQGSDASNPAIGRRGVLERVGEIRLEMICPSSRLDRILKGLWESHPYEEVAYDLYPLTGYQNEKHFIWIGELEREYSLSGFAALVKHLLGKDMAAVKFAGHPDHPVRRVAWTSGSGRSLISLVGQLDADVFLTGDTGHHDALESLSKGVALVDLDHYYTERLFIDSLRKYLEPTLENWGVSIHNDTSGPVYHAV